MRFKKEQMVVINTNETGKLMRYIIDTLSKHDMIILSSPVEFTNEFEKIKNQLKDIYYCSIESNCFGHIKRGSKHFPIIRCKVFSNKLDFASEFDPKTPEMR